MHVRLFWKDLSDRVRSVHEKLQEMSMAANCRTIRTVLMVMAVTFSDLSFDDSRAAAMEFTDQVHWAERYGADGTLTTR